MSQDQRRSGSTNRNGAQQPKAPDPEVTEKPKRRKYSAEYKRRIVEKAAACTEPGELGQMLREEGLYTSHLSNWRRELREGGLANLTPKKRGRKGKPKTQESERLAELEKENRRLQRERDQLRAKLKRADAMLDLQKKVSEILEIPLDQPPSDEESS